MDYYWFLQTIAYFSLVAFLIPIKYFKKILVFSFIGGLIYTIIVQYIAVYILNLWVYNYAIITIMEIPLFFITSWFAVTIIYGYLLMRYPDFQLPIFIFFILFTVYNNNLSINDNVIKLINWSLTQTLMFAVFSHILLLYFLKHLNKIEGLGAKENMFSFLKKPK